MIKNFPGARVHHKNPFPVRTLLWASLFAIAMGYLESAVVIYMREILYPAGFNFPLSPISAKLATTELFRELATLIMLLGAGVLLGKTITDRFAWFIYCFGVWDIFFYIFLKLLIGWPASFFTWDILFLLPVTWTGPVIAPLITSCLMMILAIILIYRNSGKHSVAISRGEWIILVGGAAIIFASLIWDYTSFILQHYNFGDLWVQPAKKTLFDLSLQYLPDHFPYGIFTVGCMVIISVMLLFVRRTRY